MLARILWFILALAIFALAFFFLAAAVVAGVILFAALAARIWWVNRKIRRAAEEQILTTEYSVIEREPHAPPGELALPSERRQSGDPLTEKDASPRR
jgi:hypothetical protein